MLKLLILYPKTNLLTPKIVNNPRKTHLKLNKTPGFFLENRQIST